MLARADKWIRSHRKTTAALVALVLFAALNFLAYRHAHAMMHFLKEGERTPNPEALSFGQKVKVLVLGVQITKPSSERTPQSVGLPFEVHRFSSQDGTELESWYIPRPAPRGMVCIFHGYASCKANMLAEAAAFHELGYATFLVDFRGSGGSSGYVTTVGVREADDVAAVVHYAEKQWPGMPVVLYGQSMGSAAILRAIAVDEVRPKRVIIESVFDRLTSTVANRFKTMRLPSFPFAQLLVFWGGVDSGFNGFGHNPVEYARKVDCPVLMFHGKNDIRVTQAEAQSVYENLASGFKTLRVIPKAGHDRLQAADPRAWTEAVSGFLKARALAAK